MMYTNEYGMVSSEISKQIARTKTYLSIHFGPNWYDKYEVRYSPKEGVYVWIKD